MVTEQSQRELGPRAAGRADLHLDQGQGGRWKLTQRSGDRRKRVALQHPEREAAVERRAVGRLLSPAAGRKERRSLP